MYKVKGTIWIETDNGAFIGNGRLQLLEKIKTFGSISAAARDMKMSYRQAWELVSSMNRVAGRPLVEAITGGNGGGGAVVTEEGEKVIAAFRKLHRRFEEFNARETEKLTF